jgi:hypothetical protein
MKLVFRLSRISQAIVLIGLVMLNNAALKCQTVDSIKPIYIRVESKNDKLIIPVSDVELPVRKLEETKYVDIAANLSTGNVEALPIGTIDEMLVHTKIHPVIGALHYSFAHHRPIVLSPDMVWLMILQGLSKHFYFYSDSLKNDVYSADGKTRIVVQRDDFVKGEMTNKWAEVFPVFSDEIKKTLNRNTHSLFTHDFSTTTENISISYKITLMDAMSEYYSYDILTACGIPYVILEGKPEDWKWIKDQLPELRRYGLDFWIDELQPVVDEIYKSSTGNVNTDFWKSFYKWQGSSGGNTVSGWIIKFFPYLERDDNSKYVNPYLDYDIYMKEEEMEYYYTGMTSGDFNSGLAGCDFKWKYYNQDFNMQFLAGFVGIKQGDDMSLRPEISWFIAEKPNEVIEVSYDSTIEEDYYNFNIEEFYENGKEIDIVTPCYDDMGMLFSKTCSDPDTYPIFEPEENTSFDEGWKDFVETITSYYSDTYMDINIDLDFVISAEGKCLCVVKNDSYSYGNVEASYTLNNTSQWKPATKNGVPVAVELNLKLEINATQVSE